MITNSSKISNSDIYSAIQLEALSNIITSNDQYMERKIKRYISKNYNVNLFELNQIDFNELLLVYYESLMEECSQEDLYNKLCNMLPEIVEDFQRQEDKLEQDLLREQEEGLIKEVQSNKKKSKKKLKVQNNNQQQLDSTTNVDELPIINPVNIKFDDNI